MDNNYKETNREDFVPGDEIPVAHVSDEEANKLIPAELVEDEDNFLKITFSKPYNFEGEIFNGIDLSGLEDIKGRQLTAIEKAFGKAGVVSSMPETTSTYAKIAASAATGLPAEFFEDLPGKEVRKIKSAVTRFFYEED
jgi:hypothetical protein